MFTYLVNDIFPLVGEFFGKLTALANISIYEFRQVFFAKEVPNNPVFITFKNFFTGATGSYIPLDGLPDFIRSLIGSVGSIAFFGVPNVLPVWVGLVMSCVEIYFLIAIISFVRKIVKN